MQGMGARVLVFWEAAAQLLVSHPDTFVLHATPKRFLERPLSEEEITYFRSIMVQNPTKLCL